MSRIDEALKRAKTGADEAAPSATPAEESPAVPTGEVFSDAWNVDDDGRSGGKAAREAEAGGQPVLPMPAGGLSSSPAAPQQEQEAPVPQPVGNGMALSQGFNPSLAEKIVAMPTIRPASVEQYRRLAATFHHAQLEQNIRVVMVTSAIASEGKTLTATNLALTFSESYHRSVLLIDADLRRPTLHETFQVPNVTGLGDGLRSGGESRLSLIEVSPRLTLLTAGRPDPDPISGLTSDRMKRLLEEAAARFDWVIVDTPPVGLLPDANLMARMVDSTLFVIRAGQTPYQLVQKAIAALGRDRIMGIVLNGADESVDGAYSYYRYYDSYTKHGKRR